MPEVHAKGATSAALCLVLACATGCERKAASDSAPVIRVNVAESGAVTISNGAQSNENPLAAIQRIIDTARRDADGASVISIEVHADPGCEYESVYDLTKRCRESGARDMWWVVGDKRLEANLPIASRNNGVSVALTGEVIFPRDRSPVFMVSVYWVNGEERVIYSSKSAFPPDWTGPTLPFFTTDGAHIKVSLRHWRGGDTTAPDFYRCGDTGELSRTLAELGTANPGTRVIINPGGAVPFSWIFDVLAACRQANAKDIRLGLNTQGRVRSGKAGGHESRNRP